MIDKNHGVPSNLIMKDLNDVMAVFEKYGVTAYLGYGAVLGAVREKDFIKWDDDIDLDVIDAEASYETRKKIGHTLLDLGFKNQPITFNVFGRMELAEDGYNGDAETGIYVFERNFKFSVFWYKKEGNEYVCTPKMGSQKLISNLTKFYDKPGKVKLHGKKFITPGPVKEYLTYMYGDWKTPNRENAHAPQYNNRVHNIDNQ